MTTVPTEQPSLPGQTERKPLSNLAQRILTGLLLLPVVLGAVIIGGLPLTILVSAIVLIGVLEFFQLARNRAIHGRAILGAPIALAVVISFHLDELVVAIAALLVGTAAAALIDRLYGCAPRQSVLTALVTLAGVIYIAVPAGFLIALRAQPDGLVWVLIVLAITWGTDSFAYIGGRLWGRTPLAPLLSPKKTREGALVGVFGGIVPAMIVLAVGGQVSPLAVIMILIGPFVAILGDLVESGLKRAFDVKDSAIPGLEIFPGHGGVLDRVDALILVTTFCFFYIRLLL